MSAFCVPIFRVSLYIWILETVSPIVHPERHNRFGNGKKHFPFIRAFRWKDRFLLYVIKRHFTWYQHKGSVLSWQLLPTSVFKLNFCLHNKPRFSFSFILLRLSYFPRCTHCLQKIKHHPVWILWCLHGKVYMVHCTVCIVKNLKKSHIEYKYSVGLLFGNIFVN